MAVAAAILTLSACGAGGKDSDVSRFQPDTERMLNCMLVRIAGTQLDLRLMPPCGSLDRATGRHPPTVALDWCNANAPRPRLRPAQHPGARRRCRWRGGRGQSGL